MKRQRAEQRGREAERQAADWLTAQGWGILAQRVRTPVGEIDLIAKHDGIVAFVEVKYRRDARELDHAIDMRRLSRVAAAVEYIGHEYATGGEDWRIDVILLAPGASPRHITNAWQP